jgi:ParB-like chromosome segregation protein Spo0J
MHENGQRVPIEVLPDGFIICGRSRVEAAKLNGWTTIRGIVRDALVGDDAAIERRLVEDNLLRRHLSPLEKARCAKGLFELEKAKARSKARAAGQRGKLRDKIGAKLRVSGREVNRLLRILETPSEVQLAYEAGKLPRSLVDRLASLGEAVQHEIANRIRRDGQEHARAIVQEFLAKEAAELNDLHISVRRLTRQISRFAAQIDERRSELKELSGDDLAALERVGCLVDGLLSRYASPGSSSPKRVARTKRGGR